MKELKHIPEDFDNYFLEIQWSWIMANYPMEEPAMEYELPDYAPDDVKAKFAELKEEERIAKENGCILG